MSKTKGRTGLYFSFLVVLGVIIAACATNPGYDAHKEAIKASFSKQAQAEIDKHAGKASGAIGALVGNIVNSQAGDAYIDKTMEYHNYGLFSTTTAKDGDDNKRVSLGVFGKVHIADN